MYYLKYWIISKVHLTFTPKVRCPYTDEAILVKLWEGVLLVLTALQNSV